MQPSPKQISKLQQTGWFDPEWYISEYLDVKLTGLDPAYHYLVYGTLMQRDPGPNFPAKFYREVYAISDKFEPATRLKDLQSRPEPPSPKAERILRAADQLAMSGRYELALEIAEMLLPMELRYTANILRANDAAQSGDKWAWLKHANAYLAASGVAPIALKGGNNLFDELTASTTRKISGGPLVSILMPAYNAEESLRMAVNSLLEQTWTNIEILIVDDCSQDGTWEIMRELSAKDCRVRVFRNATNVGPYISKNIAMSQARGVWITGHDADDWAHPERIERQVAFNEELSTPFSISGMLRMAGDGTFVRLNKIGGLVHDGACRSALISLMIKTQYFRDVLGYWDSVRVGGDSELLRRIEQIEGRKVPQLPVVTMVCYDNPKGLTNHAELGYSENTGVSPHRALYRDNYLSYHRTLTKRTSRVAFATKERAFEAPSQMLNEPSVVQQLIEAYETDGLEFSRAVAADVAIVTNFSFPGGNASSTIDEINFFNSQGLQTVLIHCPTDESIGQDISKRFRPWQQNIINWTEIERVDAKVLICRHPRVLVSSAFSVLAEKLHAAHCFAVKNNSSLRPNGDLVYDISSAVSNLKKVNASSLSFCAISDTMRAELVQHQKATGEVFTVAEMLWTPTFDLKLYEKTANLDFSLPYTIGRHGRDGKEKWLEDCGKLLQAYPDTPDYNVIILGGAANAERVLGELPRNWFVYEFGAIEPGDYLKQLDAFVYFPDSRLEEAFGRTIVEAMLAAVPVILPKKFETTFGELAIYCDAADVQSIIQRMAAIEPEWRVQYLTEVQEIAVGKFSSSAITQRLIGTDLPLKFCLNTGRASLSPRARAFRDEVYAAVEFGCTTQRAYSHE